jgi:predicted nucleic acid-binding protein
MPAPDFLDTNVLVYAYDAGNPEKRELAQGMVRQALGGGLAISTQVLAEFSTTLLHKMSPGVSPDELLVILDALEPIRLVEIDCGVIRRAVEARRKYGVHFYDGMILATAERGGCNRIWSEDMSAGQEYFGVTVRNPFK